MTVLDEASDRGVSLALSVDDPLLEVALETFPDGGLAFRRELLRLGDGRNVTFSAHLVGHRAAWRPALRFMLGEFPEYFVSSVPDLASFEGLGSYTWNMSKINATRAKSLGFKVNARGVSMNG